MRKQLCACGCGDRVTPKVERRHITAVAPALLASQVLEQNQMFRRRRNIGLSPPFHQQPSLQNLSQDHVGPSHHSAGPSHHHVDPFPHHVEPSHHHAEPSHHHAGPSHHHAGPSQPSHLTDDDAILLDDDTVPVPSSPTNNDVIMGEVIDDEVYGLSQPRRSKRIANHLEQLGQQRWRPNDIIHLPNHRELVESDEEEQDIQEDEAVSDFDVDDDEGLEGDDDDELIAGQGQEGISPWDILGEGFLKEASQLGIYSFCIIFA